MKFIILIILFFSFQNVFSCQNFLPLSEVVKAVNLDAGAGSVTCEQLPQEQCLCYEGINWHTAEIVDNQVDDLTKPLYSKNEVEECSGEADCQAKLSAKECAHQDETAFTDAEFTEVWCSRLTGYEQKIEGKKLQTSSSKLATYTATQEAAKQKELGIQAAIKAMKCGERVKALLVVRNASKGLTKPQIKQMNQAYAEIKDLLETGSLETAKDDMIAVEADGTLITEADKTALVAELDACK